MMMADEGITARGACRRPPRVLLAEAWHRRSPASPDWLKVVLSIEGLVAPSECRLLHRLAREGGGGEIVEIGSYRGRATAALAFGSRAGAGATVHAVDPHTSTVGVLGQRYGPADGEAWRANIARAGVGSLVREVARASPEAASGWVDPIELLFVDGDHAADAVRADIAAWAPFVVRGGRLALHDSLRPAMGPTRVLSELLLSGKWVTTERVADTTVLRRSTAAASR
jgi:MMP 1-O-methyltransferase